MHLLDREYRYTDKERDWLEERFEMGLLELMRTHVYPCDENGRPTGGGILKAQVAFIFAGIRHAGPAVTEARVREWLAQVSKEPLGTLRVINKAVKACMASGALGYVIEDAPVEPEEMGKEEAGATPAAGASDPTS